MTYRLIGMGLKTSGEQEVSNYLDAYKGNGVAESSSMIIDKVQANEVSNLKEVNKQENDSLLPKATTPIKSTKKSRACVIM